MVLFLGPTAGDVFNWWPITSGDEYPIADLVVLLPEIWAGTWFEAGTPETPAWVASDNAELAEAAADSYGGLPVYALNGTGFPVAPEG